jgi:[acyl-carrier-protein] S-malonyltransferase
MASAVIPPAASASLRWPVPVTERGKVAWVFPGQGSQRVGMAADLVDADPETAALFEAADATLGFRLSAIIREGPDEALQQTPIQQPAILLVSIAYLEALQKRHLLPAPDFVAGHSLGEYAALVAAGSLSLHDALRLVRRRGELMQEHGRGAMAAILGLDPNEVVNVAREAGAEVANYNAPDQTTVSGSREAVERAMELAKSRGAKRAILLPVSAAFHSSRMEPAAIGMRPLLAAVPMQVAAVPLVGNVEAQPLVEPEDLRRELLEQICGSVRWVDDVEAMRRAGVTSYYEVGPGKVLAGLIARSVPEATVYSAERLLAVSDVIA